MTAINWDDNKTVSTEEVIQMLECVRRNSSTFLHDEPHFTQKKGRRDVIGNDDRFWRF